MSYTKKLIYLASCPVCPEEFSSTESDDAAREQVRSHQEVDHG